MKAAPRPSNEVERLNALRAYNVLDTPPEEAFDDLSRLASQICETPIALVSLVDADRDWFKSKVGLRRSQTPRDISFSAHAIAQMTRLRACKRCLSRNDARVILMSQMLLCLSNQPVTSSDAIREHEAELERAIDAVYAGGV